MAGAPRMAATEYAGPIYCAGSSTQTHIYMHIMMNRNTALAACLALLVSACATTPTDAPPPPENEPASQAAPAPGTNWDVVRNELITALQPIPEAEVRSTPEGLQLRLPTAKGFESGKTAPRPALTHMLDSIAPTLAAHSRTTIAIVGHTDSTGSEMTNLKLSIARAEAVMEYLRERGIDLERLSADGKGEAEPIADNARDSGRARNRRVEIHLRDMP